MSKLLSLFPDTYTPNPQQVKLLKNIEQAFEDGYKFVVCSAPTGSGKSFISKTLGNSANGASKEYRELVESYQIYKRNNLGGYQSSDDVEELPPHGAFVLTITKSLQDQYKDLFPDIDVLKGKSNYECAVDPSYTVEYAPCLHAKKLKEQCWDCNKCPYYNARNSALVSPFATLNYNMFFALPSHTKRREYIVCDEASELEDQLVKEFSCQISFEYLRKCEVVIRPFPSSDNYASAGAWVSNLSESVEDRIEELKEIVNKKNSHTPLRLEAYKTELVSLMKILNKMRTLLDTWNQCEYIFERVEKGINFTPLKVDKLSSHIFSYADKIVLMSATIIDPANFCKSLGIDKFKYIEADSTFDPNKAPIYAATKTKLNYHNLSQNLPKIVDHIKSICELHKTEKGIIHSQTNFITNYLKDKLTNNRFLFREPGVRNEDILDIHYNTEDPTVLISPSMSHGVDLRDDLARFQIIIKAPYLPVADKRIEKLMKLDFNWYQNKMLSSFIQSCGRGVRSHKDHCVTYVLDAAITECIVKNKSKIPKYFIDRFM